MPEPEVLLEAQGLAKAFRRRGWLARDEAPIQAVSGVDLEIRRGEIVGLAGESGSGKTVTAELVARLHEPDQGRILFAGRDVTRLRGRMLRDFRRRVQVIFQNPYDSLNPRLTVEGSLLEPLIVHRVGERAAWRARVSGALERTGLRPADDYLGRYPHELSGGECQRVCIARALVLGPELLIADEPTTMLDVSVRAGILALLRELRRDMGLAVLFISHDFATIWHLCDRTAIMYRGLIVEYGPTREVLGRRLHPYTEALAAAVPVPDPDARRERVALPEDGAPPAGGCVFAHRCPLRLPPCSDTPPPLRQVGPGHLAACHLRAPAAG